MHYCLRQDRPLSLYCKDPEESKTFPSSKLWFINKSFHRWWEGQFFKRKETQMRQGLKENPALPKMDKRWRNDFLPPWSQPSNFNYLLWSQKLCTASQNLPRNLPCFFYHPNHNERFISYIKSTTYCSCCCSSICQIFPNSPCLLHSFLKSSMSKITNSEKKQSLCFSDISPRFSVQYPKLIKVCSHR